MYDQVGSRVAEFDQVPDGANMLCINGHVDFVGHPSEWPVETFCARLCGGTCALR